MVKTGGGRQTSWLGESSRQPEGSGKTPDELMQHRVIVMRCRRLLAEQPERLRNVFQEVLLPLHDRKKTVGAEGLHMALEAAGQDAVAERTLVKVLRLFLHFIDIVLHNTVIQCWVVNLLTAPLLPRLLLDALEPNQRRLISILSEQFMLKIY